jgi:Zn-dependent protease
MDIASGIFLIVIIIFSAIIHEVMHGFAADKLGDPTARYAGRLTLNPIPHIDPFGSILLPAILILSGSPFFFAWAKPVPYNPYNLRPGRFSEAIVAGAGPASNAVIALIGAGIIRLNIFPGAAGIIFLIVVVNVMLCIFNLIPVPPLDGSKVLEALLPRSLQHGYAKWRHTMEMNPFIGMAVILLIVLVLGDSFGNLIYSLANALSGIPG